VEPFPPKATIFAQVPPQFSLGNIVGSQMKTLFSEWARVALQKVVALYYAPNRESAGQFEY